VEKSRRQSSTSTTESQVGSERDYIVADKVAFLKPSDLWDILERL